MKFFQLVFLIGLFTFVLHAGDNPRSIRAIRIIDPPKIDGHLNDSIWSLANVTTDFIQRDPDEGQAASERTEIRVLYDHEALYFGCMFFDSEPDNIVARLTRRDNEIESDRASIRIDSYHDHQTGYEFTFNAAGVKVDILQYDDANREDESWDPVWDLQTKILPNGWSAEIKIPFHVLRYRAMPLDTAEDVWGINFLRYISRKQESDRWAFTPKSQSGFISRYGHLLGLRNLPEPRQFDVLPFVLGKQRYEPASSYIERNQKFLGNAGVDVKYGLSSNFSLDATVNPDFGQVEADPAVLNLSAFETFYPEKRPFFIEGTQIIRFTTFGGGQGPGMFYSRRIGRAISSEEVDVPAGGKIIDLPQRTAILGAAKVSGKTNGGLSIGVLQAITREEKGIIDTSGVQYEQMLEPFAHYNVLRVKQDILDGSNVGAIFTSVEKQLRFPSFTNGYDWNLRLDNNTYLLNGFLAFSHTTNPDNDRVTGSAGKWSFAKTGGEHWLWSLNADYTSKKYNINDVGFFFSPNDIGYSGELDYKEDKPSDVVRNYRIGISTHHRWDFDGANLFRQVALNTDLLFTNYWFLRFGTGIDAGLYDHRETRGNGLYRKPANYFARVQLTTDSRSNVVVNLAQSIGGERSRGMISTQLGVELKPESWMEIELESEYGIVRHLEAWVDNISLGGTTASIFGNRSTDEFNLTLRSTITFTRELTLQFYSQVFLAKGHYDKFRRLISPSEFDTVTYTGNPDFNRQSLNTNVVLRWEYSPG
ncbi:MAG TPA: DUF5916 domain-containing protein, partial [Bacteroidota bacterium]|nr:DUF5916 domain-containing protein [Bacteroidota bacterium]